MANQFEQRTGLKALSEKEPRPMTRKRLNRLAQRFEADKGDIGRAMGQLVRYVLNPASDPPKWLKAYLKEDR